MDTRISVETPPKETFPLPDGCNAYKFDGSGKCFPKEWDLAEGRGNEFCWYHVALPDRRKKLASFDDELTEALCPPLKRPDISRVVSSGPFCGHVDGALFIRVNSSGPALNKFNLRFAARVTERSVITVSLGLNPISGLFPSDIPEDPNPVRNDKMAGPSQIVTEEGDHPENPKLVGNDEIAAPAETEEEDPESKLDTNHEEPDNWVPTPKTVGNLLVRILDRHVDHLQKFVTELENDVDKVEAAMDWKNLLLETLLGANDHAIVRGKMWNDRSMTKKHLDLQRLLQIIAHVEHVFRLIKEKCNRKGWWAAEDKVSLGEVIGSLRRLKENVQFIDSRVTAIQADVDSRQAEQINRKLYNLSILSVIFLPLSFITGAWISASMQCQHVGLLVFVVCRQSHAIFGMSVGGMPWTDHKDGFRNVLLLCGMMLAVILASSMFGLLLKRIFPPGLSLGQRCGLILVVIIEKIFFGCS